MPYGIPWHLDQDLTSFECFSCRSLLFRYSDFCPMCGAKHPSERRGYALTGRMHKRLTDVGDIQAEFDRWRGCAVRLGSYCVSHSELEFRMRLPDASNLMILCAATERIVTQTEEWQAALSVSQLPTKRGTLTVLLDESAGLRVECHLLVVYCNVPPGL
jgi:hypothetical protein